MDGHPFGRPGGVGGGDAVHDIPVLVAVDRAELAPSRRFYAGGGGSVRGYAFQAIGP